MIESWIKDLDFLAPYLKEKLEADEEHTWEDAPYIHEVVKKLIREKKPSSNYSPAYTPTFWPLDYFVNSPAQFTYVGNRALQANVVTQQIQHLENQRTALLFDIAQQQQNERIRSALCSNTGYTQPTSYYPCSQYYPF